MYCSHLVYSDEHGEGTARCPAFRHRSVFPLHPDFEPRIRQLKLKQQVLSAQKKQDNASTAAFKSALSEINFLTATTTAVGFVEFVGKNFLALAAGRTFAIKRFETLELLITGTVLGG